MNGIYQMVVTLAKGSDIQQGDYIQSCFFGDTAFYRADTVAEASQILMEVGFTDCTGSPALALFHKKDFYLIGRYYAKT